MARLIYLVAPSVEAGAVDLRERHCTAVARSRFVSPEKDDIRIVTRFADFIPLAGVTPMLKSSGYDEAFDADDFDQFDFSPEAIWSREKVKFDEFVASGKGEWLT